jgi:signal transduction histidine kinase
MLRLDPRRHLAAAIGWAVLAISTLSALLAATVAAETAERRAQADAERLLRQFAAQVQQVLAAGLETRRAIIEAGAAQILASRDRSAPALRAHLDALRAQFPEFAGLGLADPQGLMLASVGSWPLSAVPTEQPWFEHGRAAPFIGAVRAVQPLGGNAPLQVIDIAAPLIDGQGQRVGVLAALLSWSWVQEQQARLMQTLDPQRRLDLLLAAADGTVLLAPSGSPLRRLAPDSDLGDAGRRLVGLQPLAVDTGWTVAVLQDADAALGPAHATRLLVFLVVLLAGLIAALSAALVTRLLTRRLALLAEQAQAVQLGSSSALTPPGGDDEVSRIGATLARLIAHLQQEKQALTALNTELDARVTERTARIEQMASEARHAAVTRERLRLARDLHDTLAHSLMALLTQVRLVRKLHPRLSSTELDEELGRAEAVAASGLADARAAIGQMRHNAVEDVGLGAALRELLSRFADRTGIATTFDSEPLTAPLVDERAAIVYRIAEEALHNIERHAAARTVQIDLSTTKSSEARVELSIRDDGLGFDPARNRPGHYGLQGMREQAALIQADFELHSAASQGCQIRLVFAP